jgi:phosphate transport system substrate-binding protein
MKSSILSIIFVLVVLLFSGCDPTKEVDDDSQSIKDEPLHFEIEGLTFDNYPKVDGSTSTAPLMQLIFCKLFGFEWRWISWAISSNWDILPIEYTVGPNWDAFRKLVKSSQTNQSFIKLIDKEEDLILVARKMSPDEKSYADVKGVSLIETPVALDAFVFIINPENSVKSLTIKQIQDIYTGKITNWKEVGGNDAPIKPYVRNANSGSQELMESLVMKDLGISDFPIALPMVPSMWEVLEIISTEIDALCYTVYYYQEYIQRATGVEYLKIEGIYPDTESISKNTFPLTAEVYATIRSDLDKSSTAYKLYELLQTKVGKEVISESGYVPY